MIILKNISAYFKSLSFAYTLVKPLNNTLYGVSSDKILYDGLDGNPTPLKRFTPKNKIKHILIIYPGASYTAEEHEKLQPLGTSFARIGYEVYIPRIPPLKALHISDDVVNWMSHFYGWVLKNICEDSNKISLVGVSFGGAMLLKTSLTDVMIKHPPKALFTYGTYYQFKSVTQFLYSGVVKKNDINIQLIPDNWALIGILYNFLPKVNLGFNTNSLVKALRYHIYEDQDKLNKTLKILNDDEKKIWFNLIKDSPSIELKPIMDILFRDCKDEFNKFSPSIWGNKIKSRVFIIHGSYDSMVPYTESVQLANILENSILLITDLYSHKDISFGKKVIHSIKESHKALTFIAKFLRETII